MNDLTKEEILDIVRESNKEKLKEFFTFHEKSKENL